MDERAKIPVSLPCANPTVSYWQDPPDELADHRSTPDLPEFADTVIIGSGITGAAVAWGLLQGPKPGSILMLEARQACSGATGRNGGHTKAATYRSYPHHLATHGPATAQQIARLELRNIRAVHAFARERAIACDLHPCETVDVLYDEGEWDAAREGVEGLRRAFPMPSSSPALGSGADADAGTGEDGGEGQGGDVEDGGEGRYTLYSREEVLAQFPVHDGVFEGREERVQGGVGYFAGSLSAYKFGIGVLKACVERGLNLQTGTAVTGLVAVSDATAPPPAAAAAKKGRWEVSTERGVVRAGRVVLATNGYTAAVWPKFQGAVVPLRGQITAQRPGRGMPAGGCLDRTYSFIYERGYEYMVSQPEGSRFPGDIIMGGGLARAPEEGLMEFGTTDDGAVNEKISDYLRETTGRYFGPDWGDDHPEGRVRREWTGIMGFSPDGSPFVGEVPGESELWASCGFQGHGMVLCWECARALVEMMESRDGEELREWFPDIFRITEERMAQRFRGRLDAIPTAEKK